MRAAIITALKNGGVIPSIVILGIAVYGGSANELGLYRDDAWIFMQGLLAAEGDQASFILSDTSGSLLKERPVSYFAWMIARIGFAVGLSVLHWILLGLLVLNAIALASIARRIVDEDWFVFVVGAIFLTYPLSPTQAIAGYNIHYLMAGLFALLATLFFLHALESTRQRRLCWLASGSALYLASLLTHEGFFGILPTFVAVYLLFKASFGAPQRSPSRRSIIECIGFSVVTLGLYFSWRKLLLPFYEGNYSYGLQNYRMLLEPDVVAKNFVTGVDTVFIPWDRAFYQILLFRPPLVASLLAFLVSAAVWIVSFSLLSSPSAQQQNETQVGAHRWLQPVTIGIISVLSLLLALSFSPATPVTSINGIQSRINFAALSSIALALPAFLALLVEWPNRKSARLIALSVLFAAGFTHPLVLLNDPRIGAFLKGHSLQFLPSAITWITGTAFALLMIGYVTGIPGLFHPRPTCERREVAQTTTRSRAVILSGIIAFFVLIGSLFQASVAHEWSTAWKQYRTLLVQLESIAPALEDDTFVFVVGNSANKTFRNVRWRVVSGSELSVHMLALYRDWSILGYITEKGAYEGLQFYFDGFEIPQEKWFPPGVKGPVITRATVPIRRINYDRLILVESVDGLLRLLPEMEVRTVGGEPLIVKNNPQRIRHKPSVAAISSHNVTR